MTKAGDDLSADYEALKLRLETEKLKVEIRKLGREAAFYPVVVLSGALLALVAFVRLFLVE